MTVEEKAWIDQAGYEQLLGRWRFARLGDPMFQGDTGEYYKQVIAEKRKQVGDEGHVSASKSLGWKR